MQLGMVGLGRMGANLVRRLMRDGHECVVFDVNPDAVASLASEGATGADSLDDFVAKLEQPRAAWVMVPAGEITESTVNELASKLDSGDAIIDGGNSYYRDDIRRSTAFAEQGIGLRQLGRRGRALAALAARPGGADRAAASDRGVTVGAEGRRRPAEGGQRSPPSAPARVA